MEEKLTTKDDDLTLCIPRKYAQEVADVIRFGLLMAGFMISDETKVRLEKWCENIEHYLKQEK